MATIAPYSLPPAAVEVQQLRETVALRPPTPRCEATRVNRYYSDKPGPLPQCEHSSSFVLNGRHYCKRHAGDVALRILLEQAGQAVASRGTGQ